MIRAVFVLLVGVAACGAKSASSICNDNPPPPSCGTTCDPTATNTCPAGFHCSNGGTCDAQCTPGGGQCGAGQTCTSDGFCTGGSTMPDASCPAVHFTPMPTTPSVELLLDRSGSMNMSDISPTRYRALQNALVGATGVLQAEQAHVYFGAALFSGDQSPCLNLNGFTVGRALNNATAISTLIQAHTPGGSTPTADAIDQIAADFAAHPPPPGSPPVILLATDGEPNSCSGGGGNGPSINSTKAAYAAGIRTFIIGLAGVADQYLQDIANAGTGKPTGQAPNCAACSPFFVANNAANLTSAFNAIINGVISCDLTLNGHVDPNQASSGTVTLNGMPLHYGTDWTLDPNGMTIHILGNACTRLKNATNPTVDAAFSCGSIIQ